MEQPSARFAVSNPETARMDASAWGVSRGGGGEKAPGEGTNTHLVRLLASA